MPKMGQLVLESQRAGRADIQVEWFYFGYHWNAQQDNEEKKGSTEVGFICQ
jgi:hypothetical protein